MFLFLERPQTVSRPFSHPPKPSRRPNPRGGARPDNCPAAASTTATFFGRMKSPILKPGRIFCLEEEFTMKTTAMVLAASLAAFVPVQAQAPESAQDMIRKVESEIVQTIQIGTSSLKSVADKLKEMKIPGLSVAVVKGFAVHWEKGYGVRD